jgi:hypothetical protein
MKNILRFGSGVEPLPSMPETQCLILSTKQPIKSPLIKY